VAVVWEAFRRDMFDSDGRLEVGRSSSHSGAGSSQLLGDLVWTSGPSGRIAASSNPGPTATAVAADAAAAAVAADAARVLILRVARDCLLLFD
jgi:hypothetical protein